MAEAEGSRGQEIETTLAVVRGIALLVTQCYSIPVPADSLFNFIGRAWVVGIPMPALLGILILRD